MEITESQLREAYKNLVGGGSDLSISLESNLNELIILLFEGEEFEQELLGIEISKDIDLIDLSKDTPESQLILQREYLKRKITIHLKSSYMFLNIFFTRLFQVLEPSEKRKSFSLQKFLRDEKECFDKKFASLLYPLIIYRHKIIEHYDVEKIPSAFYSQKTGYQLSPLGMEAFLSFSKDNHNRLKDIAKEKNITVQDDNPWDLLEQCFYELPPHYSEERREVDGYIQDYTCKSDSCKTLKEKILLVLSLLLNESPKLVSKIREVFYEKPCKA